MACDADLDTPVRASEQLFSNAEAWIISAVNKDNDLDCATVLEVKQRGPMMQHSCTSSR